MMEVTYSIVSFMLNFSISISILPDSIFVRSKMSFMILNSCLPLRLMMLSFSFVLSSNELDFSLRSTSVRPIIEFSGVLNS